MEQWKLVLADYIYTYGRAGKKVGNGYRINIVCMTQDVREDVYHAIYRGVNDASLSTDFKKAGYGNDELVVWVELGSKQAVEEFENNLAQINQEVSSWRSANSKGQQVVSKAVSPDKSVDIGGIVVAACLIAVVLLILSD